MFDYVMDVELLQVDDWDVFRVDLVRVLKCEDFEVGERVVNEILKQREKFWVGIVVDVVFDEDFVSEGGGERI